MGRRREARGHLSTFVPGVLTSDRLLTQGPKWSPRILSLHNLGDPYFHYPLSTGASEGLQNATGSRSLLCKRDGQSSTSLQTLCWVCGSVERGSPSKHSNLAHAGTAYNLDDASSMAMSKYHDNSVPRQRECVGNLQLILGLVSREGRYEALLTYSAMGHGEKMPRAAVLA